LVVDRIAGKSKSGPLLFSTSDGHLVGLNAATGQPVSTADRTWCCARRRRGLDDVRYVHARVSRLTLPALICVNGENRVLPASIRGCPIALGAKSVRGERNKHGHESNAGDHGGH
jgi:hypothetical protein